MGLHKGQTNNPSGRPKKDLVARAMFVDYLSQKIDPKDKKTRIESVVDTLIENATNKKDTIAAKYLADQYYGKARETVDASVSGDLNVTIKNFSLGKKNV
jgi:hypothetical protein